jgi:hypothetical protein
LAGENWLLVGFARIWVLGCAHFFAAWQQGFLGGQKCAALLLFLRW